MDYNSVEQKMDKSINYLMEELSAIRAGRANPAILNKVEVEYYGMPTPINQVGTISVPEARQILVTPWDKSVLVAIEKAIQKAEIGINPVNDGNSIRLNFPELNEQRRKELVKEIKVLGEDAKVAIRNVRRESIDHAKVSQKASEITEDELKGIEDKIQKITDKYIENIDKLIQSKEKEIMEI
ncbi:MAG: ribosome recycling factor [Clostridia bacterium]|nr:ribosome recycling factor [Clostridia bacterium]